MAQDWDIKPRDKACHGCKKPFEDKQYYQTALFFGDGGYTRADYCVKCWSDRKESGSSFSMWQGVFRQPTPRTSGEEPLKKETAESLLRRLMTKEDESKRSVMYILAVMLERKRIFAERDVQTRDDGTMIRVYEHRGTGETFLIADPRLRLDQLEQVQREIVEMLGGDAEQKLEVSGQKSEDRGQGTGAQTAAKSNSH